MNSSPPYIDLALKILKCSQKDLAQALNVSPTQISKWKKGEYISVEMQEKFNELLHLGPYSPEFILLTGSLENAKKWDQLIQFIAESVRDNAETGYNTIPLYDDLVLLSESTLKTLQNIGVNIPCPYPDALDLDFSVSINDDEYENKFEHIGQIIEENPYSSLIYDIFTALNDIYGFYAAYISEFFYDDDLDLYATDAFNIEYCLLELAACKIETPLVGFAPNFQEFKFKTIHSFEKWINIVKEKAFRAGLPLRAELMNLIYDHHDAIGHEAEAESLGFNKARIHPDIYMNELLTGIRVIHQVLPAILKKLEIYEDFTIDKSNLRL